MEKSQGCQSSGCAHTQPATGGRGERDIEPIKCMCSPHSSYRWRGERDIEPIKCMRSATHQLTGGEERGHRANQVYCAHHTPATGGEEERVIVPSSVCAHHTPATGGGESIDANQVDALTTHQLQGEKEMRVIVAIKWYALTTHQLQVERRESHRANQVYALTTHQLQVERRESTKSQSSVCAHHTPATGGEEREIIEPIKCMRSPHTSYRWRGERS